MDILALPRELRDEIYTLVLAADYTEKLRTIRIRPEATEMQSVMQTRSVVQTETHPVMQEPNECNERPTLQHPSTVPLE
ncbi:hypothetical protein HBH98_242440 [Parastagonospora nodorum]|nr:hypothetical protein HBI13_209340 [Parastagonospora nodorum]KAH4043891.1 hypothetical protein HBH49_227540 [Parastagonospora nodorum]KAH4095226.1 hypothetical protein HBH46_171840 [Parastagonospora nodorum]KAH4288224.1 hypothetical protein HBI02_212900 [Parastagonospora nodorum]KAH4288542.1 hypothetical protein HBI01_220540 [Parastagonospora nodorum]